MTYLNTKESCEYLGIHYTTFRRWIKLGYITNNTNSKKWTKEQLNNVWLKYKDRRFYSKSYRDVVTFEQGN